MRNSAAAYSFIIFCCLIYALDRNGSSLNVIAAVLIHEAGHLLMIKCCGGKIDGIFTYGAGGRICYGAERLSYGMDAAVCAAGPAASAVAALLGQAAGLFDFACASMGLCVLNLLPAYPLDGGRVLECFLPFEQARKTVSVTSLICALSLCAAGSFLAVKKGNFSLLAVGVTIFICHIGEKGIK